MTALRLAAVIALTTTLFMGACGGTSEATSSPGTSASPSEIEGEDAAKLPSFGPPGENPTTGPSPASPEGATLTFNDVQAKWQASFAAAGLTYSPAKLRLFTSAVATACGPQTSEIGPFYCPADQSVNLDLSFFAAMEQHFGVRGFAVAYVIGHEVGHHIQQVLGIHARVAATNQQHPAGANALSVRVELQADCFAGVWAHTAYARNLITPSDVDDALHAAAVVGDDFNAHLKPGQRPVEDWTHGSSAQRQRWFTVGFDSGSPGSCDTYSGSV
jgi:predicted metalloprotease